MPTVLKYGSLNLLETSDCPGIALPWNNANSTAEWRGSRRADLGKTEGDRLTVCCVESDELQFLNIFFANKYATLISVDLLQCVC